MPTPLQFLDFDLSEDPDGLCNWSALASPPSVHGPALLAEVQALLRDLTQQLGVSGPLDEGHLWDMALDTHNGQERCTVSLHLAGGQALQQVLQDWLDA